ncbi:MAG: 3-oxoacyl-[acyl-carrier-protein] reductase [Thermodesulfobacteriota bacterium]|nr:3-oxoacyl-[acyl-carrier-protein] reductase [Thermodesulfobacteriota bacterium]
MSCEQKLKGKIAVVTGGSRGIGRVICLKFARLGAHIFVNDVCDQTIAQGILDEIAAAGGTGSFLPFDVADTEASSKALKSVIKDLGVHILVNNAGVTRDSLLARMKAKDWDLVMSVNLKGAFNCTQAVIMAMIKQRWGRIVSIGSVVGSMGNPGQANYAASKAGLEGFTKSVARETASRGVTANVVAPGFIETGMTAVLPEKVKEQLLSRIPAGRMGSPEDVAEAVGFLASEEASYITGQVLHVNGGLLCD